jgi:hypothetical protein
VFAGEEKQGGIAPNYLFSSRHFWIISEFTAKKFIAIIECGTQMRI